MPAAALKADQPGSSPPIAAIRSYLPLDDAIWAFTVLYTRCTNRPTKNMELGTGNTRNLPLLTPAPG